MVQPAEVLGRHRHRGRQVVGPVQVQRAQPVFQPVDAEDEPPAADGANVRGLESDREDRLLPRDGEVVGILDLGRRDPGFCSM